MLDTNKTMNSNIDLTIVLPTLGRKTEVDAMLHSIEEFVLPSNISFEVIVVDQNFSNLIDDVVKKYSISFLIIHEKVAFRGLSKAKNYGAKLAKGKYICFIDDDAEFTEGIIERAIARLENDKVDIVSGRCIDREGKDSVLRFDHKEQILSLNAFENRFIESTMFFNSKVFAKYSYDERLGVGAFYGAEEGYDLVYRMLNDGIRILFDPEIKFYHPQTIIDRNSAESIRRAFTYRCGFGFLCRKNHLRKKYYIRIIKLFFYLTILPIYKPRYFKFYFADLLGSIVGYRL